MCCKGTSQPVLRVAVWSGCNHPANCTIILHCLGVFAVPPMRAARVRTDGQADGRRRGTAKKLKISRPRGEEAMEQKRVPSSRGNLRLSSSLAEPSSLHTRCPATPSAVRHGPSACLCRPSIHPIGANDDALPLQLLLFQQRRPRGLISHSHVGIRSALCHL